MIGEIHNNLGLFEYQKRNFAAAAVAFSSASDEFARNDDRNHLLTSLQNLSLALSNNGQLADARAPLARAIDIAMDRFPDKDLELLLRSRGCLNDSLKHHDSSQLDFALAYSSAALRKDTSVMIGVLAEIGRSHSDAGRLDSAIQIGLRALAMAEAIRDSRSISMICNNVGVSWARKGDSRKAIEYYHRAIAIHAAKGNKLDLDLNITNVGNNLKVIGDTAAALQFYLQALELQKELRDTARWISILGSIGPIYESQGKTDSAASIHGRQLELARAIHDTAGILDAMLNLGDLAIRRRDWSAAADWGNCGIGIAAIRKDTNQLTSFENMRGRAYDSERKYDSAFLHFNRAAFLDSAANAKSNWALEMRNCGIALNNAGRHSQSLRYYRSALQIRESLLDTSSMAELAKDLGNAYSARRNFDSAGRFFRYRLFLAEALRDTALIIESLRSSAVNLRHLSSFDSSLALLRRATALASAHRDSSGMAALLGSTGVLLLKDCRFAQAESVLVECSRLAWRIRDTTSAAQAAEALSDMHLKLREFDAGRKLLHQVMALHQVRGNRKAEAGTLGKLANLAMQEGSYDEAASSFGKAAGIFLESDEFLEASYSRINRGIALWSGGKYRQSLAALREVVDTLQARTPGRSDGSLGYALIAGYIELGKILSQLKKNQEGLEALEKAASLAVFLEDSLSLANIKLVGAEIRGNMSHFQSALETLDTCERMYARLSESRELPTLYLLMFDYNARIGKTSLSRVYADSAVKAFQRCGSGISKAHVHGVMGNANLFIEEYRAGYAELSQSLEMHRERRDLVSMGHVENSMAHASFNLGEYRRAKAHLDNSLRLFAKTEEFDGKAYALSNLGELQSEIGEFEAARRSLQSAESTFVSGDNEIMVATMWEKRASVHRELGEYGKAIQLLDSAISAYDRLSILFSQGNALVEKGKTLAHLARYEEALACFRKAMEIAKTSGVKGLLAQANMQFGVVKSLQGDYRGASPLFDTAAEIFHGIESRTGLRDVWEQIGKVGLSQGKPEIALIRFGDCLALDTALGRSPKVVEDLLNLGKTHLIMDQADSALLRLNSAQALARRIKSNRWAGDIHLLKGNALFSLERYETAFQEYEEARRRFQADSNRKALAETRLALGKSHLQKRHPERALADFQAADSLAGKLGYLAAQGGALYGKARSWSALNRPDSAEKALIEAAAVLERISDWLAPDPGPGTLVGLAEVYQSIIDLLLSHQRTGEAAPFINKSKALDLQGAFSGRNPGRSADERERYNRIESLRSHTNNLSQALTEEKSKPQARQSREKIQSLTQKLASNDQEFHLLLNSTIERDPDYTKLRTISPEGFAGMQHLIPDSVVVVEYLSFKERLFILTVSNRGVQARSVELPARKLDAAISTFRSLMEREKRLHISNQETTPIVDWRSDPDIQPLRHNLEQLYSHLIQPISDILEPSRMIAIVPTGSLFYLPFSCLLEDRGDGDPRFLIETKSISYLTEATQQTFLSPTPSVAAQCLLAFANPDHSLEGAQLEAQDLQSVFRGNSRVYRGNTATEAKVKSEAGSCGILHFATHGILSRSKSDGFYLELAPQHPESDGKLTWEEVLRLPLRGKTELVTLSACNTAMGTEPAFRGQGILTMAKAFTQAGASSVVASSWSVSDESTRRLMNSFYRNLFHMDKAHALQKAQRDLFALPEFRHPFYWSGFSLFGDYRRAALEGTPPPPTLDSTAPFVAAVREKQAAEMREFPWPPPSYSSHSELDRKLFKSLGKHPKLEDVAGLMKDALNRVGYPNYKWHAIPGGFALVAQMEQVDSDGTPLAGQQRWLEQVPKPSFGIHAILKALFTAQPGYYRVIAFAVTDVSIKSDPKEPDAREARSWIKGGEGFLPAEIGKKPFSAKYHCHALVYEFERKTRNHKVTYSAPSRISTWTHLKKARILAAFGKSD